MHLKTSHSFVSMAYQFIIFIKIFSTKNNFMLNGSLISEQVKENGSYVCIYDSETELKRERKNMKFHV